MDMVLLSLFFEQGRMMMTFFENFSRLAAFLQAAFPSVGNGSLGIFLC